MTGRREARRGLIMTGRREARRGLVMTGRGEAGASYDGARRGGG